MGDLLKELLNALEAIGEQLERLYDSDVRDAMSDAVLNGFVRENSEFRIPDDFGLHSDYGNKAVKDALEQYISRANAKASELGWSAVHVRLAAFQDSDIASEDDQFFDDFFGYVPPEDFKT